MIRVDELMTGEQLRALSETASKPEPFYTQDMGNDIFKVTYWETSDEWRATYEEEAQIPRQHVQVMKESDAVERLIFANVRGNKIISARRWLDDSDSLYEVKWVDVEKDHEVSPEELNTGPDTTENVNEVVESEEEKPVLYDPRTYRRITEENQDPESERISKAMERMKWRNRNNLRDSGDVMFGVDQETLEEVVDESRKRGCMYTGTPESDEKIRKAMSGWSKERNTDFPGAKQAEEALRDLQEKWKSMNRPVLGPDPVITPGAETIDDIMEAERQNLNRGRLTPEKGTHTISKEQFKESMEKTKEANHILSIKGDLPFPGEVDADKETEECNKNVSHPEDYYQYGRILERMDDTHRRKNSDYGDAAYKGYKKYGDYYFLTQLHNKFTRLENLTINNTKPQVEDESIDDTLLDMANYAVMYLESRHRND